MYLSIRLFTPNPDPTKLQPDPDPQPFNLNFRDWRRRCGTTITVLIYRSDWLQAKFEKTRELCPIRISMIVNAKKKYINLIHLMFTTQPNIAYIPLCLDTS